MGGTEKLPPDDMWHMEGGETEEPDLYDADEEDVINWLSHPSAPPTPRPRFNFKAALPIIGICGATLLSLSFFVSLISTMGNHDSNKESLETRYEQPASRLQPQEGSTQVDIETARPGPTQPPRPTPAPKQGKAAIIREARPAVALIESFCEGQLPATKVCRSGSGFLFDASGLVMTNAHVVKTSRLALVTFGDRQPVKGKVLVSDEHKDLAVVKVWLNQLPRPLALELGADPSLGDAIMVLGYPFGRKLGAELTVTSGEISSIRRRSESTWYQVSAAVNPGNSGGPCIDMRGRVVGVITAKMIDAEQIGFVRPIAEARSIISQARGKIGQ